MKRTKLAAGAADRLTPTAESEAIVNDAAKQLGVDPAKLSAALEQAMKNRIDAAVKDGRLTKEQGEAMKQRITSAAFPLVIGPGFGRGPHRGPGLHFGRDLDAAATFLGLSEADLRAAVRNGKTLAQVAKDKGKSVDGLVDALVAAATKRLDAAVQDGRLTKAQRDELVAGLKERTTALVSRARPEGFDFRGHGFRGGHPHGFFPGGPPRADG